LSKATHIGLVVACLTACSKGEEAKDSATTKPAAIAEQAEPPIPCALAGAQDFKPDCTREISQDPDGEVWTIRHPGGGFRRFVLIDKGTRIATADGADEVRTQRVGSELEVRVGLDRYRFPAAPEASATTSDAAKSHAAKS
jgi:hypothetical protein